MPRVSGDAPDGQTDSKLEAWYAQCLEILDKNDFVGSHKRKYLLGHSHKNICVVLANVTNYVDETASLS